MTSSNNKLIVRNTLMLYLRMILILIVNLYTSRVILNILGVVDFGIYNVVGGVVIMFSFLNGAMSSATQRFLSYEIGNNDLEKLKKVFSLALSIHVLMAVAILILAETLGLWFLNTQLNILAERMQIVQWVYQFSILTFVVSVIQVPYNAAIISHEKMNIYAYVSIAEVLLKLLMVYVLVWVKVDKLGLYAILIFIVSLVILLIYRVYCKRKFIECHYKYYKDKELFKSMLNFSGWNLCANIAWMTMGQGLNFLLNIFFGPTINAARGIVFQVNNTVSTFINNLRTAVNPQIVKAFASNDNEKMLDLVFESAKYSHYLMLFLSLPILLETNIILSLWLIHVPNYTVLFCQLTLINTLILNFDMSISTMFQAIGKIKANQILSSVIYLLVLPVSYIFLKYHYAPEVIFYIQIVATIIVSFAVKIYLLITIAKMKVSVYLKRLIWPIVKVTSVAVVLPVAIRYNMSDGILRLLIVSGISSVSIFVSVYFLGMNKSTQIKVRNTIVSKLNQLR